MTPEELKLRIIYSGAIVMIIIITYCHAIALEEARARRAEALRSRKRRPQHTSGLTGQQWVQELLSGHEDRIFNEFGMRKRVFRELLAVLQTRGGVQATRYVSAEEQLSTFLHYVHRGLPNRALQERFQRSPDTISK